MPRRIAWSAAFAIAMVGVLQGCSDVVQSASPFSEQEARHDCASFSTR